MESVEIMDACRPEAVGMITVIKPAGSKSSRFASKATIWSLSLTRRRR